MSVLVRDTASANTQENMLTPLAQLHFCHLLNAAPKQKESAKPKIPSQTHKKEHFTQALKYTFLLASKHSIMLQVLQWGNQTKSSYFKRGSVCTTPHLSGAGIKTEDLSSDKQTSLPTGQ